ncbi:MmgE/PrpD family protein [Fodinicurvata sp. EGI_FJ10296]|uniref:MmgE/PrpD family protein n=1 Tax=Fodinicurvata sp. EGI_FJ10296 TaxID=3231908 RepID=UPI0034543522
MTKHTDQMAASISSQLADWTVAVDVDRLPPHVLNYARMILLDVAGLCISARNTEYVAATLATAEPGPCTVLGHAGGTDAYGAALTNGTAAHGEDFDDTFEGGPVHSGSVVAPAVLAAGERFQLSGTDVTAGLVAGIEIQCRLSLVAPKAIHKAGFHPTAVLGALAAAAGVGRALRLDSRQIMWAMGIAGSMASGIIEYLADGSWTKRMHVGWSAQSGLRAALMAKGGFVGPATVLEGTHGLYNAFAPGIAPNYRPLLDSLGEHWHLPTIGFKTYACGTMTQPYIDCAIELGSKGIDPSNIDSITCGVGEGTVHRLWEPLAEKQNPPSAYFAKFSAPYCMAVGFFDRAAGLAQFTDQKVQNEDIRALMRKISYFIDPGNPYPQRFTGHLCARLKGGGEIEIRRNNLRGGMHDPISEDELQAKFFANTSFGGWTDHQSRSLRDFCYSIDRFSDLSGLQQYRGR